MHFLVPRLKAYLPRTRPGWQGSSRLVRGPLNPRRLLSVLFCGGRGNPEMSNLPSLQNSGSILWPPIKQVTFRLGFTV